MRRLLTLFVLSMGVQAGTLPILAALLDSSILQIMHTLETLPPISFNLSLPSTMPREGPLGPPHSLSDSSNNIPFTQGHNPSSIAASTNEPRELATRSGPYPATLLLCQESSCGNCAGFDLSTAPQNECLQPAIANFEFVSVGINQPSNSGLPYAVGVGPGGCTSFAWIPNVNTCFDITTQPYRQFALAT